jgi:translation initiation factor IF-2
MTETKDTTKSKKLGLSRPGKLELNKTVAKGQVRQSFSHGRSKMVAVEVRKKRTFERDSVGRMAEVTDDTDATAAAEEVFAEPVVEEVVIEESAATSNLTNEERASRAKALESARVAAEKAAEKAKLEAERKALEPDPEPEPEPVAEEPEPEPEPETAPEPAPEAIAPVELPVKPDAETERRARPKKGAKTDNKKQQTPSSRRGEPRRRSGKLTISEALEEQEGRQRSLASVKRQRDKEREKMMEARNEGKKVIREVVIPEVITVQELANRMAERAVDVIKSLMKMDMMVTPTQSIDADTAELVVEEFGHKFRRVADADVEIGLRGDEDDEAALVQRAPVVTIMGHVDHGKTSLLDALRETDVVAHEAGGITQHIGAYQVTMPSGAQISFLDTPGHAAFSEMRSRGAHVTDIVVLCVAADDGIMPQTVEAIRHAQAAEVPIIIAINKMDKPDADPGRVRTDLLQHDIQVEEVGGDVLAVEVSALKKQNLDKLEEAILLQAELLDLKANPDRAAEGVVVEAKMEQGRGTVATVLVQRGTIRVGDIFVAGKEWGRVRALFDAHGRSMEEAGPSVPVEILGLGGTPNAGDEVSVVDDEGRAREVAEFRQRREKDAASVASARGTLEQMFERIKEGEAETLPIVIKGDVHGSVEAIVSTLDKLGTDEVKVQVLHSAVGGINESDVSLARASNAPIIGFNVRANPQARELAKRDGVEIRYYSIIYNLTDDLKQVMSGMLAPEVRETYLGNAEIREVFNITKVGKIAGCIVTEGRVKRGAKVRLIRDDTVIHEGELSQLKRFKDDVNEVKDGTECGMAFANYHDLQAGDVIECFDVEEVARQL